MELKRRSLAKAISWRISASLTTALVVYAFTGEAMLSAGVGAVEALAKMALYYLHERAWQRVRWARHPLADIPLKRTEIDPRDLEAIRERLRQLGYL